MNQLQEEGLHDADPPRVLPSHSRTQGSITSLQPNVCKSMGFGSSPSASFRKKISFDHTHQDPAPEDRKQAANPSKSHFMPVDTVGDSDKGVRAAPRAPSLSHPSASNGAYGDDESCNLPQPRGHIDPCATSQHFPPGYGTTFGPPHNDPQAFPKSKLAVKNTPSKKRCVAEEAIRGDNNEKHPRKSWASYPSPENRGARNAQEGQLKQRMPAVTNGSDVMADLLRQRDDLEAALSRHVSWDQRHVVDEAIRVAEEACHGHDKKGHPGVSWASSSLYPNEGAHNIQGGHLRQTRPEVASGSDDLAALLHQREYHNLESKAALSRPAATADPRQRIIEEAIQVTEVALRGDGEGNPGVSWRLWSSFPNQGPHNVQEGHLRQRKTDFTSGSDGLASLLREHEYRNLELEAALSRHASWDPLYDYRHGILNSQNRGTPHFPSTALSLANVSTSPRPPTFSQRLNLSLTGDDEQELVEEILQRRRANEQDLRSYYDNPSFRNVSSDYGTHTFPDDRASMLALATQVRQSILTEQILGGQGHQYDRHSSNVASTLAAAAPLYDQQRQVSALRGTQDPLVSPSRGHPLSFATLCHPIRREQETSSTPPLAQRMMAEEEYRRRAPQAGSLMQRSPSSSFVAAASTSTGSRDSHLSLSARQRRAVENSRSDRERSCISPYGAAVLSSSSNVPKIATVPPCEEGPLPPHTERTIVSLAGVEDENWLSDFLCFVRSDLIEVFRASGEDVASRMNSKKITYQQIGFRCRFCAHLPHDLRACRSATFPSSIDRIYQSLTMIIRDHFESCHQIPKEKVAEYSALKATPSLKTASKPSKQYWYDSARRLGMMDTPTGIMLDESMMTQRQARAASRGVPQSSSVASDPDAPNHVFGPNDRLLVPDYLVTLMMQVRPVHLTEPERVGNRKGFALGMPGLGCRHCYKANRIGWAFYPPKRRLLPIRIKLLRQHLECCSHCPQEIKMCLAHLEKSSAQEFDAAKQKMFFDRIWARIHGSIPVGVPADCNRGLL